MLARLLRKLMEALPLSALATPALLANLRGRAFLAPFAAGKLNIVRRRPVALQEHAQSPGMIDDRNGDVRAAFGERGFRDLQCHFARNIVFHQHLGAGAGHGQPTVARWRWLAPAPPRNTPDLARRFGVHHAEAGAGRMARRD
jgi:hypothetical protein